MKVSVVIPTYNRCRDLERCLESLRRQTFTDFETVVIDNGSTDGTPNLLTRYPVKVIRDETKNLAHLFNLGWRETTSEVVVYINDDAEAHPDWLENVVKTFESFEDAAVVGGPTIATRNQEILSLHQRATSSKLLGLLAMIYDSVVLEGRLLDIGVLCESGAYSIGGSLALSAELSHPIHVDVLTITNMAVRRQVLASLGGFDENFRFWHIDGDFFVRLKRAGLKAIFNPKVVVWHHVSPVGATRSAYVMARGTAYFLLKSVRPRSTGGWLRYLLNVMYFNFYWLYKVWATNDVGFLRGIPGFVEGVRHYLRTL
ncbi:MAG: glycosyltransferase family 2 protein [Candidatus Bathyarchaeia archaeon]